MKLLSIINGVITVFAQLLAHNCEECSDEAVPESPFSKGGLREIASLRTDKRGLCAGDYGSRTIVPCSDKKEDYEKTIDNTIILW